MVYLFFKHTEKEHNIKYTNKRCFLFYHNTTQRTACNNRISVFSGVSFYQKTQQKTAEQGSGRCCVILGRCRARYPDADRGLFIAFTALIRANGALSITIAPMMMMMMIYCWNRGTQIILSGIHPLTTIA